MCLPGNHQAYPGMKFVAGQTLNCEIGECVGSFRARGRRRVRAPPDDGMKSTGVDSVQNSSMQSTRHSAKSSAFPEPARACRACPQTFLYDALL